MTIVDKLFVAEHRPVSRHHPLGASTGMFFGARGDWPQLMARSLEVSTAAVELSALSETEWPGLLAHLRASPLPFRFVSVHAPTKHRQTRDRDLAASLVDLPRRIDAIVVHPDTIEDTAPYAQVGDRLVLENMDARKPVGRRADELARFFDELPAASFCFDVAHAWSIDPSMQEAHRLLDRFADRLRHVHLSSLDQSGRHIPLTEDDEDLFAPLLRRCRDVPWILEAPLGPI